VLEAGGAASGSGVLMRVKVFGRFNASGFV
jgi:hypothetical protein